MLYENKVNNAKHQLVSLSTRFVAGLFHFTELILDPLFEASAEVGEWFADHSSRKIRAGIKSRIV